MLTVTNHDRDVTNMRYVYAVVSRRARGVSQGLLAMAQRYPRARRGPGAHIIRYKLRGMGLCGFAVTGPS